MALVEKRTQDDHRDAIDENNGSTEYDVADDAGLPDPEAEESDEGAEEEQSEEDDQPIR